ncbi:MAG TPA: hypothetical protein DDW50_14805 [Firmicutes bacterium]|jgi:hypothetical protein|nr:hypothetical protein [Bacillota bacterium]
MSNQNRSGTSQADRALAALQSDYVSVEERSVADLLMYVREYAKKVNFFDESNQISDTWAAFLDFTDDQILELAGFVEDPTIFSQDSTRLEMYSKPHLALLLTFLKLLQYPKDQFAALTEKNVKYFYKDVLELEEEGEVPDEVHVIFTLAQDVKEHPLEAGILLNAGKDATGVDLHYQVTENVLLNTGKVTDIRTIHLNKTATDIRYVHQSNNMGDTGFEKMLCLVLDVSSLPDYETASGLMITVNAAYLRTQLYQRIKDKERDELDPCDANYIFNSLCFNSLKDFMACLSLLYREMNQGYVGVVYPEDQEWEEAYTILAEVHQERIARTRRAELKAVHQESGFEAMMEYAFGEPDPGDMLYKMPDNVSTLEELAEDTTEAAKQYIENKLCMSSEDFKTIMSKKDVALTTVAGEEVYALLETAWTKKRGYEYPKIGSEIINGFYADTVYDVDKDDSVSRFEAFGNRIDADVSETIDLGFAVSSPLLNLAEGTRQIEMVISCKEDTIDSDSVAELGVDQQSLFSTSLSVADGWRQADDVDFEMGKFIIKPEIKTYDREDCYLVCDIAALDAFDDGTLAGNYVGFSNGKMYRIEDIDEENNQMSLKSTDLEQDSDSVLLITKLVPKTFVAELAYKKLNLSNCDLTADSGETETFDPSFVGKYLVDSAGNIFLIKTFVDATKVEVSYCGSVTNSSTMSESESLFLNKVWETVELEYDDTTDLSGLEISGIYSAASDFVFDVTDASLKISYPEGATTEDLISAWKAWKDQEGNDPARYELEPVGSAALALSEVSKEIPQTGEIMKRYESLEDNGIVVTYRGRPTDPANLIIAKPSTTVDGASFLISGNTLTITPGLVSQTANQIVSDWNLWGADGNDTGNFQVDSKDERFWEAVEVSEKELSKRDKEVKKCEVQNLYGVGMRVGYNGPVADEPKLVLEESSIDLYEFTVEDQTLTIQYPSTSITTSNDLLDAWNEWRASELNDPGNFSIETMGDGLWTVQATMEKELQSSENKVLECPIETTILIDDGTNKTVGTGVTARYTLSGNYQNALIELVEDAGATTFKFDFSDVTDTNHENVLAKKLTITYPQFNKNADEYLEKQTQTLLSKWNREYNKYGFSLIRTSDDAEWSSEFPDSVNLNFLDRLNYVGTIHADGFVVKYHPGALVKDPLFSEIPSAKVVLRENSSENFAFQLFNDYPDNMKILYINYPTTKASRTVTELLKAWNKETGALLDTGSLSSSDLTEFTLELSGSGKWQITAVLEVDLNNKADDDTAWSDLINYRFYEYKTSDVDGFTLYYSGPKDEPPLVTMVEQDTEGFELEVSFTHNQLAGIDIGETLTIKYPKRSDKRRLVDLLAAWHRYKKTYADQTGTILGFEIVDTSLVLEERSKSALLITGDMVYEYPTGSANGIAVTYLGHRDSPQLVMKTIEDFAEDVAGDKILWDNGEIFTIAERKNQNYVTVAETRQSIANYGAVKLYDADAICLEALKFTIKLDEDFPAVVAPEDDFSSDPAIKILLNHTASTGDTDSVAAFYDCFKSVSMERIDLKVMATGLADIKARGDLAMINTANPFNPFGQTPNVPARFYLANSEICEKKLDSLQFNITWAEKVYLNEDGLPDMGQYYYAYSHAGLSGIGTIQNTDFEVKLQFLDDRAWVSFTDEPRDLFSNAWIYPDLNAQTYRGALFGVNEELPNDPLDWPRYYKLELSNQSFMKDRYSDLLTESVQATRSIETAQSNYDTVAKEIANYGEQIKAAKEAEAEARVNGETYYQPVITDPGDLPVLPQNDKDISRLMINSPYTPTIQSITIDYTASAKLKLDSATESDDTDMLVSFFRFHPFGYEEMDHTDDQDNYLLPQYDQDGYLMIGISDLEPSQTVSLLFQLVSGSGDASLTAPELTWSYLVTNQWVSFENSEILKDKTYGLQDTGIIRFSIPDGATTTHTILPGNRIWIRAEAAQNIDAVPDILDIRAQAVRVTYVAQDNDPEHLATPLPADSITELETRDADIKEIEQPYTSFDGKMAETSNDFFIRVSERLKHKNRALTLDDYEKLILAQFPQIYKVKCVPQEELASLEPASQGKVVIVAILNNSNSAPFFPLKPKTPVNLLDDIAEYVEDLMPPLVNVTVRNPRFEEVTYRLAVKFTDGYDRGYYTNQLNEDIKSYLSPWAYDQDEAINFGSSVYSSSLINYLENKEYIDYVANLNPMKQTIDHDTYTESIALFLTDDNVVTTKYHDSILVSAEDHVIDVITTEYYDPSAFQGIGYMKVESDFWIARPGATFSVGLGEMEIEAWPVLRYAFSELKINVAVIATINGNSYTNDNLGTQFSRADSQRIWEALKAAGYIDETGNVITNEDLYADDFYLLGEEGKFVKYLQDNLSGFTFQIKASNFNPDARSQDEFSYEVQEIDTDGLETAVVNILKEGLAFNGISQYPFTVY